MLTFESLITQVRRRRLARAALLYILAAWFVVQFAYHVLPMLNWPVWIATALLVAALIGFPLVLRKVAAATPAPPAPPDRSDS